MAYGGNSHSLLSTSKKKVGFGQARLEDAEAGIWGVGESDENSPPGAGEVVVPAADDDFAAGFVLQLILSQKMRPPNSSEEGEGRIWPSPTATMFNCRKT